MTPGQYDAWYQSARGRWIGETEYRLLRRLLAPSPGSSVLDVGCGTGYFTRRFALEGHPATGVDTDASMLAVAAARSGAWERYVQADARALPFASGRFDYCVCVTALCFIANESAALAEMFRVCRRGVALGLLNRHSLLHLYKGRAGGRGAYRGARWHTALQARELFAGMPCQAPRMAFAVFLPSGGALARMVERALPAGFPLGSFLAIATDRSGCR